MAYGFISCTSDFSYLCSKIKHLAHTCGGIKTLSTTCGPRCDSLTTDTSVRRGRPLCHGHPLRP